MVYESIGRGNSNQQQDGWIEPKKYLHSMTSLLPFTLQIAIIKHSLLIGRQKPNNSKEEQKVQR